MQPFRHLNPIARLTPTANRLVSRHFITGNCKYKAKQFTTLGRTAASPDFRISNRSFLTVASNTLRNQTRAMSSDKKEPTEEELLERVKNSNFGLARNLQVEGWAKDVFEDLNPIHAALTPNPKLVFKFPIHRKYCNLSGNFHGGCAATMFDLATTYVLALINNDEFWRTYGVSRTLNCTYLRGAPAGSETTVTCEIISIGKRLTHMKGEMRDEEGRLLVTCEHGKVNVDSKL